MRKTKKSTRSQTRSAQWGRPGGVHVHFGTINFGGSGDPRNTFREFAEDIAYHVKRVIETEQRRSAVV
jgi:hypothetical protein